MKQMIFTAILIFAFCFTAFAQTSENSCPKIMIVSPDKMLVPFESAVFTAKIDNETEKYNGSYSWTTSRGEIYKGQGTSKIELMVTSEDFRANVTVNLKVTGLPEGCNSAVSETVGVIAQPNLEPLDQYEKVSANDEKARLESLLVALSSNGTYEGVIILEFDKTTSINKRIKRIKEIIKWTKFRKSDVRRISFMISEKDSEQTTLLALEENSKFFKDLSKDYKLVKAEEFEQNLKEIFPKK